MGHAACGFDAANSACRQQCQLRQSEALFVEAWRLVRCGAAWFLIASFFLLSWTCFSFSNICLNVSRRYACGNAGTFGWCDSATPNVNALSERWLLQAISDVWSNHRTKILVESRRYYSGMWGDIDILWLGILLVVTMHVRNIWVTHTVTNACNYTVTQG